MSVQFGRWNFDGQAPGRDFLEKVSATLAPYGPDSKEAYSKGSVNILYKAFYTTEESRRETQPHISLSGAVITWDGRLDNRTELIGELRNAVTFGSTDVAIVAASYEKWGIKCLAKLTGDWALSLWNPIDRSLILAKDPIGTRHLYYLTDNNQVTWSTILDPLVLFARRSFRINEEYVAGWFSHFPAAHLTPYVGIHAVPPSSSVLFRPGKHTVSKYWDFDPEKKIRYRSDAEYEEHFRAVFATAVQRRLRSDRPILAELSGGMDSCSIVCMADTIIARAAMDAPRLDTISWYNDSDPDVDERPYFMKVEEKRGRAGFHIDLGSLRNSVAERFLVPNFENDQFAAVPVPGSRPTELFKQYEECMKSEGHRVVLSGLAGESATGGGLPTPTPELQNLVARARFFRLAHQLKAWADNAALCGYLSRMKLFGPLPSFQDNIGKLDAERRLLAFHVQLPKLPREIRYPYADRSLLEFMYAIPREQVVRVGQRRSLMRRALVGIVPDEILNRKRKLCVQQESTGSTATEWASMLEIGEHMVASSIGIINPNRFWEAMRKALPNGEIPIEGLMSTLTIEAWLRYLTIRRVLANSTSPKQLARSSPEIKELQAQAQPKSSAS